MNGKEKEAIEYLERHILPYVREGKIKFMLNEVILNLIKKQQKEIEARLEEIDSLYKMMSVKDDEIKYLEGKLEQYGEDYQILVDKIKEKIEEYKNRKNNTSVIFFRKYGKTQDTFKQAVYTEIIGFLKDLLGE